MDEAVFLPQVTSSAFVVLALAHLYMAVMRGANRSCAVPSRNGRPLFQPSRTATLLVAIVLLSFAALVASCAGQLRVGIPHWLLSWLCYGLAVGLVGRAIGDFRYVGFFKRIRGSSFARLDTFIFSPLCLLLAAGVLNSASSNAG